eukprot:8605652-Prorocentrum_lima.AAC.1
MIPITKKWGHAERNTTTEMTTKRTHQPTTMNVQKKKDSQQHHSVHNNTYSRELTPTPHDSIDVITHPNGGAHTLTPPAGGPIGHHPLTQYTKGRK